MYTHYSNVLWDAHRKAAETVES